MDRESVTKMMLKQEEIFKQQVRELHRLYQAQKQLMAEFRSDEGTSSSFYLDDRHQSISQLSSESSLRNQHETWENYPLGKRNGFDLEQPVVETSREGVANVKAASLRRHYLTKRTTMEGPEIDSDVELSLSIGCGAGKKKPKHGLHQESEMGCPISGPSETKQPTSITPVGPRRREEGSDLPWSLKEGSFQGPRRDFRAL